MIKAGVYYLEERTGKSQEEILKMYYPDFKDRISYYTDPKGYFENTLTEKDAKAKLDNLKNKLNKF